MATVSILIPACEAEYLGRALISAQRQTFDDIEILVGDDTPDAALEEIVSRHDDARIRYFHHGFGDARRNAQALWARASGQYVKWLGDQDVLMPTSVELLADALRTYSDAPLAFHGRVFIDENDTVIHTPSPLVRVGANAYVDQELIIDEMVRRMNNFIGEPSNVMVNRALATEDDVFAYRSYALDFLGDVAMFVNLAAKGPLITVGGYWSMSRRDPNQTPNEQKATFSAGLYEWELFVRGEAAAGNMSSIAVADAAGRLSDHYALHASRLPEIARLLGNLGELNTRAPRELFDSERFKADLAHARAAVATRLAQQAEAGAAAGQHAPARPRQHQPATSVFVAEPGQPAQQEARHEASNEAQPHSKAQPQAPSQPQNICAICEQSVDAWLPSEPGVDREFFDTVEAVDPASETALCPHCGSTSHERHVWLYAAFSRLLEQAGSMRILHVAPEPRIEARIRKLAPLDYVTVDPFLAQAGHRTINLEALDFADGHFDLIICNHVLERVARPDAVLRGLRRCLKAEGRLVAQTAYSPVLPHTFEVSNPVSNTFAARHFGQADRIRLFGADVRTVFNAAGFGGEPALHESMLGGLDAAALGCDAREPFFVFMKTDATVGAGRESDAPAVHAKRPATRAKPVRLVCATRRAQHEFMGETALGRSLSVQRYAQPPELLVYDNNTTGLPTLYNAAIEQAAQSPAVLVFIHDDVSINDFFWMDRIHEALERFDVVGLAGNRRRAPRQPGWSFPTLEFEWDEPEHLSGVVGHGKGFPCDQVTRFEPVGVECKLLDGLMLIADSERLIQSGVRFDERFPFHFYDMDFCRQAELKGLRMGTCSLSVVHESRGAVGSASWRAGYEHYLRKYGE